MASLLPWIKTRFFDEDGNPLAGGKLFSYYAGTSTPLATYTDQSGLTANTNPVILDANGEANVWINTAAYKFVLKDANDVVLFTVDNVQAPTGGGGGGFDWIPHSVTDGQSATNLAGETMDTDDYSSVMYEVEIIRGTTVISNGQIAIQNLNGTGRVVTGLFMSNEEHGVTFSVSQVGTVVQLKAALDAGAGNGTIKLKKNPVPA